MPAKGPWASAIVAIILCNLNIILTGPDLGSVALLSIGFATLFPV